MADEKKYSIEKEEPGFWGSVFGEEAKTVLKDSDGNTVGRIETEKPGFFGSLFGEEAKQVIVDNEGNKQAEFGREEPGLIGTLLGESGRDVIRDTTGNTIVEFSKEEPGLIGTLLGERPHTVLRDGEGEVAAEFTREEPGFFGLLFGEKSQRYLKLINKASQHFDNAEIQLKKSQNLRNEDSEDTDYEVSDDYRYSHNANNCLHVHAPSSSFEIDDANYNYDNKTNDYWENEKNGLVTHVLITTSSTSASFHVSESRLTMNRERRHHYYGPNGVLTSIMRGGEH